MGGTCVVPAGAVPYKAIQMWRGRYPVRAEEIVDAVEESRRRPVELWSEGAMGIRSAVDGTEAA